MNTIERGTRYSITDLQDAYESGNTEPLDNLMRAWKGIKELPPTDPNSFFMLGGFHGEPFRGEGETNPSWWGGYCQHGTVLFPTWHRAYLYNLERALQSIPGCSDVMLPFWDECAEDSRQNGIPWALTVETYTLDGETIPNPLRSFVFPTAIVDQVSNDDSLYSKPQGYETVRYPLSGLMGTEADRQATAAHNAQFPNYADNVVTLNKNITTWLNQKVAIAGTNWGEIYSRFAACLDAPSYTLFSNTTSAGNWNHQNPSNKVQPLESPHNYIHLAVGGYDVQGNPNPNNNFDASLIPGANGDMGENDTAGLDPIFFFHHCFIDYVFWTWQVRNGMVDGFTIDPADPGAKYDAAVNPPPAGADPNATMSVTTPLIPFVNDDGSSMTTADCFNIQTQLGYSYGPGSLDQFAKPETETPAKLLAGAPGRTVMVSGIDRSKIRGSFIITALMEVDGEWQALGHEPVLSRWHLAGCANCQTKLKAGASFNLPELPAANLTALASGEDTAPAVHIALKTRDGVLGHSLGRAKAMTAGIAPLGDAHPLFTVEIR